jgi:hypothetical protein
MRFSFREDAQARGVASSDMAVRVVRSSLVLAALRIASQSRAWKVRVPGVSGSLGGYSEPSVCGLIHEPHVSHERPGCQVEQQ